MTTLSKEEYLAKSRGLATGFGPTVDFADPQLGATVQTEAGIPDSAADLPGQVFTVDQLPNPAVAVAYGLPPVTVPEHLILDDADDAMSHVQAKDPLDILSGQLRAELGNPVLAYDNTVRSEDDSLQVFADNTGAGLGDPSEKDDSTVFVNGVAPGGGGEDVITTTDEASGPIDPAGVQKGDGDKEPVSEQTGTPESKKTENKKDAAGKS